MSSKIVKKLTAEAPETGKKRGRGRPPKGNASAQKPTAEAVSDTESIEQPEENSHVPVKAKVVPKKQKPVAAVDESAESGNDENDVEVKSPATSRGRGRPPKKAVAKPAASGSSTSAKRGRGRPPKESPVAKKPAKAAEAESSEHSDGEGEETDSK